MGKKEDDNANTDNRTAKQRYDEEIKDINETISPSNGAEQEVLTQVEIQELNEECELVEDEMDKIDKSMGDVKETASTTTITTQSEHLDNELNKQREEILRQFTGNHKKHQLSPDQTKKMNWILTLFEKGSVTDPVLKHLVESKLDLATEQSELSNAVKEIQLEIVGKMKDLTDKSVKNNGAMEHKNMEILKYVQKNPNLVTPPKVVAE